MNEYAFAIRVAHISSEGLIDDKLNDWLVSNSNALVIDIKFSTDENVSDALIIYRMEGV